jgi:hypothetical protein
MLLTFLPASYDDLLLLNEQELKEKEGAAASAGVGAGGGGAYQPSSAEEKRVRVLFVVGSSLDSVYPLCLTLREATLHSVAGLLCIRSITTEHHCIVGIIIIIIIVVVVIVVVIIIINDIILLLLISSSSK